MDICFKRGQSFSCWKIYPVDEHIHNKQFHNNTGIAGHNINIYLTTASTVNKLRRSGLIHSNNMEMGG